MLYELHTVDATLKTHSIKHSKTRRHQAEMASTSLNSINFDQTMSLYIPRVDTRSLPRGNRFAEAEYEAMAADFIGKQFKYQRIGQVSRVDLLKKQTPQGFDYFIAFVHFTEWFDTPQARALQEEISTEGTKAKLQFHEKWYWIVNENKSPLSANEASLHKTIYEQAKQIGMLNEAVDYLKSLKGVSTSVAEAALAETAERGFGSTWVPVQGGPPLPPPSPLPRPALQRSEAEYHLPDPTSSDNSRFQTPQRGETVTKPSSPPALIRQRTVRFKDEAQSSSRNLFDSSDA